MPTVQGTGTGAPGHAPATRRRATLAALAIVLAALMGAVDAPGALALSIPPTDIKPVEQTTFTGAVATVVDGPTLFGLGGCADKSAYSATITWADKTTSTGTIGDPTADSNGNCYYPVTVQNGHPFGDENPTGEQVRIDARRGVGSTESTTIMALIQDAPLHPAAAPSLPPVVEGSPLSRTFASFTDDNTGATASGYGVTIDWRDGSAPDKTGTVTPNSTGGFDVNATHVYTAAGTYTPTITISDDATSTTATATATVTDAPLNATELPIKATQGSAFNGAVARFTDPNPGAKASDFHATIDWSDGSPLAAGTVTAAPTGGFLVSGSHTYTTRASGPAIVRIYDVGGSKATVTSGVSVAAAPASPAGGWTTTANLGGAAAVPVVRVAKPRFLRPATIVVALSCPSGPACRGELKVLTVPAAGSHVAPPRRPTVLGSTLFILDGGASETFDIRLGKRLRRRLARVGSAAVRAYATDFTQQGQHASVSEVGVIRPGRASR
jgi:hypothetical protein